MKRAMAAKGFCFVFSIGLAVPGCFLFGPDEPSARICASPIEGGEYCVPSSYGPDAAWNDAKAAGTEPIQMWAVWPENRELKDVVASPIWMARWLDDVQTVMDYLRVTQGNAESYRASLSGRLGDDLRRARWMQNEIMGATSTDPQSYVASVLIERGGDDIVPLRIEIAMDKQTMGEVQAIWEQAQMDAGPFAAQYKALVDDFETYRATEAKETLAYTQWSNEVSGAGLAELEPLEIGIVDLAHTASAKPNELLVAGMKLAAQILQLETDSRESMAPHSDFMMAHGAPVPDMSSGALRSIQAMLGYAQQRVSRSDATAKSLLQGLAVRRSALQLLTNVSSPVRATMANAMLAKASTSFEQAALVRVDAMASAAHSSQMGLPYLAQRYDENASLLQMAPLCNGTSSSWREAGCVSLRPKFKDAAKYVKVTLPALISQGLAVMKNQGVDAVMIQKVQQRLNAGDIKGAALAHDELLRSTEGT